MWNKILACCELHTKPYIIVMILSKYFFTIIQYNKGRRVGVGWWKFLKKGGIDELLWIRRISANSTPQ